MDIARLFPPDHNSSTGDKIFTILEGYMSTKELSSMSQDDFEVCKIVAL